MSHLFYHDERFSLGRKDTLIDNEASSSSIHKKVGTTMQIIYANIKRCSLQDVSVHLSYVWKEFNSIIIQYNYLYAMSLIWKKNCTLGLHKIFYDICWILLCCFPFLKSKTLLKFRNCEFVFDFFNQTQILYMVSNGLCVCRRRGEIKGVFTL